MVTAKPSVELYSVDPIPAVVVTTVIDGLGDRGVHESDAQGRRSGESCR